VRLTRDAEAIGAPETPGAYDRTFTAQTNVENPTGYVCNLGARIGNCGARLERCNDRTQLPAATSNVPDRAMSHIVIIEEDQLMRGLLVEWLTEEGYAVHAAARCAGTTPNRTDLVIADVFRPRQDGVSRLTRIKAAHPDTPIIAISGQFRSGLVGSSTAAETLGVRRAIGKPFTRRDLLSAVRSVIGPPA
jgi:CheY-like chemotaxis protein